MSMSMSVSMSVSVNVSVSMSLQAVWSEWPFIDTIMSTNMNLGLSVSLVADRPVFRRA